MASRPSGIIEASIHDLNNRACACVRASLISANKGARSRRLCVEGVAEIICEALDRGHAQSESYSFPGSYKGRPMATHCIAVRDGEDMLVRIWRDVATSPRARSGCPVSWQCFAKPRGAWRAQDLRALAEWMEGDGWHRVAISDLAP